MLTWLVLSTIAANVGYLWSSDHDGGTAPDPINVGAAQAGVCQQQWSTVCHCEMVSAMWGPGRTPRAGVVHAGRDVSGRTVDVAWLSYSKDGDSVVVAAGPGAPTGDVAIFVHTPLMAAFSAAVAAVLVMIGRILNWARRRGSPPVSRPSRAGRVTAGWMPVARLGAHCPGGGGEGAGMRHFGLAAGTSSKFWQVAEDGAEPSAPAPDPATLEATGPMLPWEPVPTPEADMSRVRRPNDPRQVHLPT